MMIKTQPTVIMEVSRFCTILIVFVLGGMPLWAQEQYAFRHLSTRDGLIQGSVYYFLEDSKGLIWMTTQAGLNRFDGHHFRSFVHDDDDSSTISKGEVRGLAQAPNGDIWVGTEVALSRYVKRSGRFQNYYEKDVREKHIYAQHQVMCVNDSMVWYMSEKNGFMSMNYLTGKRKILYGTAEYGYQIKVEIAHFEPINEVLWLIQPFGVLRYSLRSDVKEYFFTGRKEDAYKEKLIVNALYISKENTIWLSTDQGLLEIDCQKNFRLHQIGIDMAKEQILSLTQDKNGNLWLGSSKNGILVYNPVSKKLISRLDRDSYKSNSLMGSNVGKVFVDSHSRIWANIDPLGVDIIYPSDAGISLYEDNPADPSDFNKASIRGIAEDQQGNLWVGTSGEGLRMISNKGKITRFGRNQGFPPTSVRGIFVGSEGDIWISTINGLYIYRMKTKKFELIIFPGVDHARSNHIKGLTEITPKHYLIATTGGIFSYRNGRKRLLTNGNERFTGSLYFDKKNNRLFAGRLEKDLRCYEVKSDTLIPLFDGLSGHSVLSFLPGQTTRGKSVIWIGTDNGFLEVDPANGKVLKRFTVKDGLPDHVVYSTVRDNNGGIWLSTNNGLARYTVSGGFQRIRCSEGIEFNSFAATMTSNGKIYFGSTQGLLSILPKNLTSPSSSGFHISGIWESDSVFHTPENFDGLHFYFDKNNFTFELAALDYFAEIPPLYAYKLSGPKGESEWVSNEASPIVRFRNLAPNEYRLKFRVLDSNGLYTETPFLNFAINPPYWEQWWFFTLLIALGVLAIYCLMMIYLRRQQIAHQKLVSRVMTAQESERLRIARDIHDDVNNTLAAAKGYLQLDEMGIEPLLRSQHIERSRELILKATEDLRTITHDLMPIQFDQQKLPIIIEQKIQEWSVVGGPQILYIFAGNYFKLSGEAEQMIYRILSEMVQNIRKHSKAKTAIIQMIYQENCLVISVEDDGVGFDQKTKTESRGFGLKNIYSRAEYLKATVEISSDEKGVLIQLIVPYGSNKTDSHPFGR